MAEKGTAQEGTAEPGTDALAGQYRQAMFLWIDRFKQANARMRELQDYIDQLENVIGRLVEALPDDQRRELLTDDRPEGPADPGGAGRTP